MGTQIPSIKVLRNNNEEINILGANREPNFEKSKYGLLSSIIYPAGGKSIFEYGANRYSNFIPYYNTTYELISANTNVTSADIDTNEFSLEKEENVEIIRYFRHSIKNVEHTFEHCWFSLDVTGIYARLFKLINGK